MKNILKVRMLGGFTLEYKGKELVLDRNNVSKTTQLFQLLLLHTQDGEISKAALIDALYGRSDVENKNGSLNNTSVYHMKNNEREDFNSELDLLKIIENCQNSTKNVAESG